MYIIYVYIYTHTSRVHSVYTANQGHPKRTFPSLVFATQPKRHGEKTLLVGGLVVDLRCIGRSSTFPARFETRCQHGVHLR